MIALTEKAASQEAVTQAARSLSQWCIAQANLIKADASRSVSARWADLCGLAFCSFLCLPARDDPGGTFRQIISASQNLPHPASQESMMRISAAVLLPAGLLLEASCLAPAAVSDYLRLCIQILQPTSDSDGQPTSLGILEKQAILAAAGRAPAPLPPPITNLVEFIADLSVPASSEAQLELALRCEAHTLWGLRPPRLSEPDAARAAGLLRGLAIHRARQYDLVQASRLMRASLHLTSATEFDLISFILAQQNHEGAFGHLAPEVAILKDTRPDLDIVSELYIPVAIEVGMLLGELAEPRQCWLRRLSDCAGSNPIPDDTPAT